jgi:hypothetical protein
VLKVTDPNVQDSAAGQAGQSNVRRKNPSQEFSSQQSTSEGKCGFGETSGDRQGPQFPSTNKDFTTPHRRFGACFSKAKGAADERSDSAV